MSRNRATLAWAVAWSRLIETPFTLATSAQWVPAYEANAAPIRIAAPTAIVTTKAMFR